MLTVVLQGGGAALGQLRRRRQDVAGPVMALPPEGREVALVVVLDEEQLDTDVVELECALVRESLGVDLVKLRVVVEKQIDRGEVVGDALQIDVSMCARWAEGVQLFSPAPEDPQCTSWQASRSSVRRRRSMPVFTR